VSDDQVRRIQRAYPRIWHACHVEHASRRRDHGLSDRDVTLLGHLDETAALTAGALAKHLGVGASTVTEAIDRLEAVGLVDRTRAGRKVELRLTRLGADRLAQSSILDAGRLAALVALIPDAEAAVRGIEQLAEAGTNLGRKRANRRA
jgi:DNA-binding MarR family transcriptional regulator